MANARGLSLEFSELHGVADTANEELWAIGAAT
jgi:hypothetical protein